MRLYLPGKYSVPVFFELKGHRLLHMTLDDDKIIFMRGKWFYSKDYTDRDKTDRRWVLSYYRAVHTHVVFLSCHGSLRQKYKNMHAQSDTST